MEQTSLLSKIIFYYKHLIIVISLLILATPQYLIFGKLGFIIVGLGALLCVADALFDREFLRSKRAIWLVLFLISFAITLIINRSYFLNLNCMSFGYTAIALILLYPNRQTNAKATVKEMYSLNNTFLIMTAIFSTVGFVMYVVLFSYRYNYAEGADYIIGWSEGGRLFGLYSNPGLMITAIAIAIAVIQYEATIYLNGHINKKIKFLLIYSIVINFCCMVLENASGAYISLAMFIAIYLFLKLRSRFAKLDRIKSTFKALLFALLSVALLYVIIYILRFLLSFVPGIYYSTINFFQGGNAGNFDAIKNFTIERNIPENYGALTGRPQIWVKGIELFLQKPVFGWGPVSFGQFKVLEAPLRHLHNLFIESLAGVGLVGSVLIFFFLASSLINLVKKIFCLKLIEKDNYYIVAASFAFLMMLAVNSLAEVTILYMTRLSVFMFWLYLGYVTTLTDVGDHSHFDKPFNSLYRILKKEKNIEK